ncbi:hypothetical protein PYW07_003543 [Mythimna separata]|uniref:Peptidase S1 domain-containing protein n=1 Tax=Mythimna separata TaxID=271217 RepID=A0AAD7YJY1_MYTSE|nr:hypothetical protein PYW07_003543 [Mythimna separata]
MRSALWAALLLAAAAVSNAESVEKAPAVGESRESEQEEESDTAPFMIVVEHAHGRRCGGSLVSLRTALTSAWCAGGGEARDLWALAPGTGAARRVARVALAAGAGAAERAAPWAGAAVDLAVLELEAPFGGGAHSRPILMATQPSECAAGAQCHVVRALGGGRTPRLRIVDAALAQGDECAARSPGWPGLRDTALCVVGPTLCSSDWGAGVVCEGKLCGVLSRSARAAGAAAGADETCGDAHVAQSIPRWRKFLHCAHTLRACGRGGDCGQLCSEHRLLEADASDSTTPQLSYPETSAVTAESTESAEVPERTEGSERAESSADTEAPPEPPAATSMLPTLTDTQSMPTPVRLSSVAPPTRSTLLPPPPQSPPPSSPRAAFEFEPNRADFKGGPERTSRVSLKAGEYGDNAAEYGGEDAMVPTSPKPAESSPAASSPAPPSPAERAPAAVRLAPTTERRAPPAPARRAPPPEARVQPVSGPSSAAPPRARPVYLLYIFVAITNLVN